MKLVVLSTRTRHHIYFLQRVQERFDIAAVLFERRTLQKSFPTGPFFDDEQDRYEARFFDSADGGVSADGFAAIEPRCIDVHSVNQPGVAALLGALEPDLIWVYGAGLIKPPVIAVPRWGMVNLHGGISQRYRGLDSLLWAIEHRDYASLGVTVHYVAPELDTGPVLRQAALPIAKTDEIYHLRYKVTRLVTELSLELLAEFERHGGPIPAEPQTRGPYYSAMPLETKRTAHRRFLEYRESLDR